MKVVLASKNKHKLVEINEITKKFGFELILQSELGVDIDVEGPPFECAMIFTFSQPERSTISLILDASSLALSFTGSADWCSP